MAKTTTEPEPITRDRSSVFWRTGLATCAWCGNVIGPTGLTHNRAEYGYWIDIIVTTDGVPIAACHEQCASNIIAYGPRQQWAATEFLKLYRDYHGS